jgi:addiction module RelB/DinJ family antitoxin
MSYIQIRMDAEEKAAVQAVLSDMGLTLSGAVKLFLRKVVQEGEIPFSLQAKSIAAPLAAVAQKAMPLSSQSNTEDNTEEVQTHHEKTGWTMRKIGS